MRGSSDQLHQLRTWASDHFLRDLPIRPVLIGTVYDPTFGDDDEAGVFGVDTVKGRRNFKKLNARLTDLGRSYGASVDLHAHFLTGKPGWYVRTIEPSLIGASEVRRCFLRVIESGRFA